jgi:hypothetical protein
MKQLVPTGLDEYIAEHKEGDVVTGRMMDVSGGRARVELGEGISGSCKLAANRRKKRKRPFPIRKRTFRRSVPCCNPSGRAARAADPAPRGARFAFRPDSQFPHRETGRRIFWASAIGDGPDDQANSGPATESGQRVAQTVAPALGRHLNDRQSGESLPRLGGLHQQIVIGGAFEMRLRFFVRQSC